MFINLMTEAHINLSSDIISIIENYYNDDLPSLIHIYNHGLCITQNINGTTNISIYLSKPMLDIYEINREIGFYNKENISFLKDMKIINNNNTNYIFMNDELNKINFITSCNFCKNIQEIQFTETNIPNNIIQNIDFGWLEEKIIDFKGNFTILLSDQINGIIIKIIEKGVVIYINVVG